METRFIDDQFGDLVTNVLPTYSPANGWTQGASCTGCGFHPDPSQAFYRTWHDTTHHTTDQTRSVQFGFTGTSLDVFCIIPNPSDAGLTSTYNLTFELDDQPLQETFVHISNSSNIFQFNVSVLSLENLALAPHTFVMLAASTVVDSTLQFDYAMYTTSSVVSSSPAIQSPSTSSSFPNSSNLSSSTSTTTPSVGAIVGATIGGTLSLVLIISLISWYLCCKRRGIVRWFMVSRLLDHNQDESRIEPFPLLPLHRAMPESSVPLTHIHTHARARTTSDIQSSSATFPSTIITNITAPSYHQTSEDYLSSGSGTHENTSISSPGVVRFAEGPNASETSVGHRHRNRTRQRSAAATPSSSSGRSTGQTDNTTIGTASSSAPSSSAPSSSSSAPSTSRRREVIRELKRTVEDLKRQQRELVARLPPSYEEHTASFINRLPP